MTQIKLYDTVVLLETIDSFPRGTKGAVIEIYTQPQQAFDIEIVLDSGQTVGILESVQPNQIICLHDLLQAEIIHIMLQEILTHWDKLSLKKWDYQLARVGSGE